MVIANPIGPPTSNRCGIAKRGRNAHVRRLRFVSCGTTSMSTGCSAECAERSPEWLKSCDIVRRCYLWPRVSVGGSDWNSSGFPHRRLQLHYQLRIRERREDATLPRLANPEECF